MELRDVSFKNQSIPILNSLNMTFSPGLIGLIGDNGQGKTTLLQIMSGILEPSQGHVLIDDQDIYKNLQLKQQISYLPAHSFLYPHLKLLENFHFIVKVKKLSQEKLMMLLPQFFSAEELQRYSHVLYSKLSDGLKKRAMLVASLLPTVRYYFFDEPCTALSMAWRKFCWEYLAQLSKTHCVVVSSHHPDELIAYCKHAYTLEDRMLKPYVRMLAPC